MTVAVIGACHLDTIARYSAVNQDVDRDVPGSRIDYAVGGAAYNAAVHLRGFGHAVRFMTVVGRNTLSELVVRNALLDKQIGDRFICVKDTLIGHGYVAFSKDGKTERAVTFTAFDESTIAEADVLKAIQGAKAVVIDSNLSVLQIAQVGGLAMRRGLPVFGVVASDAKAMRFIDALEGLPNSFRYRLVSFNEIESRRMFPDGYDCTKYERNASRLRADVISCSMGRHGQSFSTSFAADSFPAYSHNHIGTETGAGDALFASLCHYLIGRDRTENINLREMNDSCAEAVMGVLNLHWATKDAGIIGVSAVRHRSAAQSSAIALFVYLLAMTFVSLVVMTQDSNLGVGFGTLISAGTVFGLLGGLIAIQFDRLSNSRRSEATLGWGAFERSCFGAIIGGLTSLIYLLPPVLANASLVPTAGESELLPLMIMIAFIALGAGYIGPSALRKILQTGDSFGHPNPVRSRPNDQED